MDNDDWEEDERIERKDLRKMENKTLRRDHNSRRSQKRAGADDASRRGRTRGATIVQPNLEGHVADLRPASTSVDGEDVTSFGRVGAAGGVLFTWGGEIYDVDKIGVFGRDVFVAIFRSSDRGGQAERRKGR